MIDPFVFTIGGRIGNIATMWPLWVAYDEVTEYYAVSDTYAGHPPVFYDDLPPNDGELIAGLQERRA